MTSDRGEFGEDDLRFKVTALIAFVLRTDLMKRSQEELYEARRMATTLAKTLDSVAILRAEMPQEAAE